MGKLIIEEILSPQQGNRKRTLRIHLPAAYDKDVNRRFPVLYMHDGQNMDNPSPYSGYSWKLKPGLASLSSASIPTRKTGFPNTPTPSTRVQRKKSVGCFEENCSFPTPFLMPNSSLTPSSLPSIPDIGPFRIGKTPGRSEVLAVETFPCFSVRGAPTSSESSARFLPPTGSSANRFSRFFNPKLSTAFRKFTLTWAPKRTEPSA